MKRIVLATLVVILLLSVSSCSDQTDLSPVIPTPSPSPTATAQNNPLTNANTPNSNIPVLSIIPQDGGLGSSEVKTIGIVSDVGFINKDTKLAFSLPVYVNQYAYNQAGPMFEVTSALKETMTDNLALFLSLLYGKDSAAANEITMHPAVSYQMYFANDEIEAWSGASGLSIINTTYNCTTDSILDELKTNPLLIAAVEYLGLENIKVTTTVEYDVNGNQNRFNHIITEESDDTLTNILNNSFSYITVIVDKDGMLKQVRIRKVDTLPVHAEYTIIPYDDMLSQIKAMYSLDTSYDVKTEIYYNTTAVPGYFVPCYRLYFIPTQNQNAQASAHVMDVAAIDLSIIK